MPQYTLFTKLNYGNLLEEHSNFAALLTVLNMFSLTWLSIYFQWSFSHNLPERDETRSRTTQNRLHIFMIRVMNIISVDRTFWRTVYWPDSSIERYLYGGCQMLSARFDNDAIVSPEFFLFLTENQLMTTSSFTNLPHINVLNKPWLDRIYDGSFY